MSSPIKAFYLKCILNAKEMAMFFETNEIAKVSSVLITLCKSVLLTNKQSTLAYVCVEYWYDTEAAYNFIKLINRFQTFDTRLLNLNNEIRAVEIKNENYYQLLQQGVNNEQFIYCYETIIDEYNLFNYVIQINDNKMEQNLDEYITEADDKRENWITDIHQMEQDFGGYMMEVDYVRKDWSFVTQICDMV